MKAAGTEQSLAAQVPAVCHSLEDQTVPGTFDHSPCEFVDDPSDTAKDPLLTATEEPFPPRSHPLAGLEPQDLRWRLG